MGMVAPQQRIASAFVVCQGTYGAVTQYAQHVGVSRQWVYRQAAAVQQALTQPPEELQRLRAQVQQLQRRQAQLEAQLACAVVLDEAFATLGQARGVSLRDCQALLELLLPGRTLRVASLGRRTHAAGQRAGQLLAVLDELARAHVREAAADEIYVKAPVLMVVEPGSLCWVCGRLTDRATGEAWQQEFVAWPHLEQVTRDAGPGLAKGVHLANAQRQAQGQAPVVDQGDHFHALRGGGVALRQAEQQARQALARAEAAQQALEACQRQGHKQTGPAARARHAWLQAEQAMDRWQGEERLWQQAQQAVQLFTPTGELNTRARAEAVLAETLPQLPDRTWAKVKRQLRQPELLNYLDRVQQQLAAVPLPEELKRAAVRQEGLRCRPHARQGEGLSAAALRGVLLVGAVVLSKAGAPGQQAVAQVRALCRRAYRASSLVECVNSVLRMHQAGQRRMTQGLLDLKRLYWNCHRFGSGRRRHSTPYQRLGIPWPDDLTWEELLKMTPEQLRDKLSTAKPAA